MKLNIDRSRPINDFSGPHGSIEIIDDVIVDEDDKDNIKSAITIPSDFINLTQASIQAWIDGCNNNIDRPPDIVCPGNGAWLVERLLSFSGIKLSRVIPVNISRETLSKIEIPHKPKSIIIIEDVVETGTTSFNIFDALSNYNCPKHLVCAVWHDRTYQTQNVLNSFARYASVHIGLRIYSKSELADIRSLSTLARKTRKNKNNLKYSYGKEVEFIEAMDNILKKYSWVNELGKTIGYRLDE